jgi:methionyl-tRNA formyltransferase
MDGPPVEPHPGRNRWTDHRRAGTVRIAFLGMDGPLSIEALRTVAQRDDVVAIVRPAPATRRPALRDQLGRMVRALGLRRRGSLAGIGREIGTRVTTLGHRSDPALASLLRASRPDLLCVASFPWLLAPETYSLARLGAINVHAALLPRHRGLLPLFWIYHADDRETGVTIHWMSEQADAGDVLVQSRFPLPRGLPVDALNRRNAAVTGPLLGRALAAIAAGDPPRVTQDESRATAAPFVRAGTPMVAFDTWGAERTWHFLAGLYPRFIEPLRDARGDALVYRGVQGFSIEPHCRVPGTIERAGKGARLFCHNGFVRLET